MDTSNSTPITPLNAGVKPLPKPKEPVLAKRAFVPSEHLTHRPFEGIKTLLNAP